jgi:hypothetical protein
MDPRLAVLTNVELVLTNVGLVSTFEHNRLVLVLWGFFFPLAGDCRLIRIK